MQEGNLKYKKKENPTIINILKDKRSYWIYFFKITHY